MKNLFKVFALALVSNLVLSSCEKDKKTDTEPVPQPAPSPTPDPVGSGNLKIRFSNFVDSDSLVLGTNYTNPNGETYSLSKFKYYISNIVLTKADNSVFMVNNFYQIISHSENSSRTVNLTGIPAGSYKAVKLMLGVDSARNRSGAQTGGLDIVYANDMYWSWSQGYIFLKLEGTSAASTSPNKEISYHLGGYGGIYKTQREYTIDFAGMMANITTSTTPTIELSANVNEIFKNPVTVSFATYPTVLSTGKNAKMVADNYADMIKFGSIKN